MKAAAPPPRQPESAGNLRRQTVCACSAFSAVAFLVVAGGSLACGKKGPPLPPLVKLPAPPDNLVAERRGDTVDLSFTVPAANTDGTRPANVQRAEVVAITAPPDVAPGAVTDDQLLKFGAHVGGVDVKAPRDPNLTTEPDETPEEFDPGTDGVDQGASVRLSEAITAEAVKASVLPPNPNLRRSGPPEPADDARPLLAPALAPATRTYAAFGISTRGRKGPLSRRVAVPLGPPPAPPRKPSITYDEQTITISWDADTPANAPDSTLLPSRLIGAPPSARTYNVYDTTTPDAPVKLTGEAVKDPEYSDTRMAWGETRCYSVRAAERVGSASLESEASPPACATLVDTFPPAAPKDVTAIPSEGAINLIWAPNTEKDLAGYVVLRSAGADPLAPLTKVPIQETAFRDAVQAGVAFSYVVKAVDKAGNESAESARVTETAR